MSGSGPRASAYSALAPVVDQAVADGRILWEPTLDRDLPLGRLAARVRFVPTFAERALNYAEGEGACGLCPGQRRENLIDLPVLMAETTRVVETFCDVFDLRLNNFPYLRHQMLACVKDHTPTLTASQFETFISFVRESGFLGGAMQVLGSGATVPGHAHLALFAEHLPIFDLPLRRVGTSGGVPVSTAPGYPGVVMVFGTGEVPDRCAALVHLLGELVERGLSFNLLFNGRGDVYVAPRQREHSHTAGRKIGFTAIGGLYTGYVERESALDVAALRQAILDDCNAITEAGYTAALRETVWQATADELLNLLRVTVRPGDRALANPARRSIV